MTPTEPDALLSLNNVCFGEPSRAVLQNISLIVKKNEIATIIGPNGAGKSTLIKLVCGLLSPYSGRVWRQQGLDIGYMPQRLHLDQSMPIKVSRFLSLADSNRLARMQALEKVGIGHLNQASMHQLSGGEFQRVLLARAILRKPQLLVLDEPLQGVDINGQTALYKLIASLRQEHACSILMVSHDLHLVMAQTDKVICLNQHICCHGKPESVSQHPEYLRMFGLQAMENVAVYTHHHDHHHDIHGDVVNCEQNCKHDV